MRRQFRQIKQTLMHKHAHNMCTNKASLVLFTCRSGGVCVCLRKNAISRIWDYLKS